MNDRVVWRRSVADDLYTAIHLAYENSRDAAALRQATADVELRLSDDPANEGESRAGTERVFIIDPLTVIFEVFESSQTVMIYDAVYYPRQRL